MPCYNERHRIRAEALVFLAERFGFAVVAVDDGSTDGTAIALSELASRHPLVSVLTLDRNVGKGEAVRHGLLHGRALGFGWVGYFDVDLSTPPEELARLLELGRGNPRLDVVLGSRVALLGRTVVRSPFRHASGRVFATCASRVLGLAVYDTQCGAKMLRATPELDRAIARPFRSRWAFDVELLGRLARLGVSPAAFWEEPLRSWCDAPGSRRSLLGSIRATLELVPIWRDLRRSP